MTPDQRKKLLIAGWTADTLDTVAKYLEDNSYTLFNLAHLGSGQYRVMFRDKAGKVAAQLFSY